MVPLTVMYDGDCGAGALGPELELAVGAVESLHDVLVMRQTATRTGTIRVESMGGSSKGYDDVGVCTDDMDRGYGPCVGGMARGLFPQRSFNVRRSASEQLARLSPTSDGG